MQHTHRIQIFRAFTEAEFTVVVVVVVVNGLVG